MTTKKINTLIKEKLGKDITGQEAEGEIALPDGALGNVSGGMTFKCSKCGGTKVSYNFKINEIECETCLSIDGLIRTYE